MRKPAQVGTWFVLTFGFFGGISFWGGFNTTLEATNTEAFCFSCHTMSENVYQEYKASIHYKNRSGVKAICSDCHVPHEWSSKMMRILLGPGMAAVTAVGYVVINVGVGNVIEPQFMGQGLGISPLVIIVSLIFWGWLLGPIGMLLSVPLTLVVKAGLESGDATRPIAVLLGPPSKN